MTAGVVVGWTATRGASLLDFEGVEKKFPVSDFSPSDENGVGAFAVMLAADKRA